MDPQLLTPILFAALLAWGIFRRLRRTFGRQRLDPGRMWFRVGILILVSVLYLGTAMRDPRLLAAFGAGAVCGIALGVVGLRHTQFESTPQGRFYTPHTYIGLAVTVLFLGRVIYRLFYMYYQTHGVTGPNPDMALAYQRNPLSLGIFGTVVAYYLSFYGGILTKTRASAPAAEMRPTD